MNFNRFSRRDYPVHSEKLAFVGATAKMNNEWMSIEEWLDWQCEDGWELFKFHPQGWCVFRKQIFE
jgi:hypothetical protein